MEINQMENLQRIISEETCSDKFTYKIEQPMLERKDLKCYLKAFSQAQISSGRLG